MFRTSARYQFVYSHNVFVIQKFLYVYVVLKGLLLIFEYWRGENLWSREISLYYTYKSALQKETHLINQILRSSSPLHCLVALSWSRVSHWPVVRLFDKRAYWFCHCHCIRVLLTLLVCSKDACLVSADCLVICIFPLTTNCCLRIHPVCQSESPFV